MPNEEAKGKRARRTKKELGNSQYSTLPLIYESGASTKLSMEGPSVTSLSGEAGELTKLRLMTEFAKTEQVRDLVKISA